MPTDPTELICEGGRRPPVEADPSRLPSNGGDQPPGSGASRRALDEVLGLDGLTLKFPIRQPNPISFEGTTTRQHRNRRMFRGYSATLTPRRGFDIELDAYTVPDQGSWAKVSFNPRRHPASPDTWHGCPVAVLDEVLDEVWAAVDRVVARRVPREHAGVAEIHVARDHTVPPEVQPTFLTAWSHQPVPRATRRPLWHSPEGRPQSFSTGTKVHGLVRAYDHSALHGSPVGTFRVEVEAHDQWASAYGGISTVADINAETIQALYCDRYRYAGLHLPVIHRASRFRRLYELTQEPSPLLTVRQLPGFVGREHLFEHGIVLTEGSSTHSLRRRVNERVGLAHDDHVDTLVLDPHYDEPLVVAP